MELTPGSLDIRTTQLMEAGRQNCVVSLLVIRISLYSKVDKFEIF